MSERRPNKLTQTQAIELYNLIRRDKDKITSQKITADRYAKIATGELGFTVTKTNCKSMQESVGIRFPLDEFKNNGMLVAISNARDDSREALKAAKEANFVAGDLLRRVKSLEEQLQDLKTRLGEPTPEAR